MRVARSDASPALRIEGMAEADLGLDPWRSAGVQAHETVATRTTSENGIRYRPVWNRANDTVFVFPPQPFASGISEGQINCAT